MFNSPFDHGVGSWAETRGKEEQHKKPKNTSCLCVMQNLTRANASINYNYCISVPKTQLMLSLLSKVNFEVIKNTF